MPVLKTKNNVEIHFNDIGQGDPVVLIHGWPLSSAMWEYQLQPLLSSGFRVISYDRRGFGHSAQPASGYDYDTMSDDLNELLTELNLRNVSLVGMSMGGGEIARYLSRHGSARIKKAVLLSSVVPYLLKTADNPNGVDESVFADMVQNLKEDRPKFLASFAKDFYGVGVLSSPVSAEFLNWTASLAYPASPKATIDCVTAFGKTDFRPDLTSFTVPTLVIHGKADKTVPIACSGEAAARGISGAIFKAYDGAPHGLFYTHKNQLNEDLIGFLKK